MSEPAPAERSRSVRSELLILLGALGVGKAVVLASVYAARPVPDFLYLMSTRWDAAWFVTIARVGYTDLNAFVASPTTVTPLFPYAFAFPPFYPAVVNALSHMAMPDWFAALLAANVLSVLVPVVVYVTFGFRAALLMELFPTYLVYTTIPYSEALTLLFLSLAVLLALRGRLFASSGSLSLAFIGAYSMAWAGPSFALAFWKRIRRRTLLFYLLPLLAGGLVLYWFQSAAGSYLYYFTVENVHWHVSLSTPWDQAVWLAQRDHVGFWPFPGTWVTRNLPFEAFYAFGALYLLISKLDNRVFLSAYSLSVILPLFFIIGGPAEAIPRLLMPAFPVFAAYAVPIRGRLLWGYAVVCLLLTVWVAMTQTLFFFS